MTLFQAHRKVTSEGADFWIPCGPAFFDKVEAQEYFQVHYRIEADDLDRYELRETPPLSL